MLRLEAPDGSEKYRFNAWVRAGPALEYSIPEVEGCPPAQPYSAVQQWMQQDIHEAVKADKGILEEAM